MYIPRFADPSAGPRKPAQGRGRVAARGSTPSLMAGLDARVPVLTLSILTVLGLVFIGELAFGVTARTGLAIGWPTSTALGALDAVLALDEGEWWRIATAPFLHASLNHLIGNAVVLLFIGAVLERMIGRGWLAALYVVSGLGGAIGALLLNPPDDLTVGASGAIMGLLSAAFVLSLHPQAHEQRQRLQWTVALVAIPALIPAAHLTSATLATDYSSHFGGAVAGAIMGVWLQTIWPETVERPLLPDVGAILGAVGFIGAALGFIAVGLSYPSYVARGQMLIPVAETPTTVAAGASLSTDLLARYPNDPRSHVFRAAYFANFQDWPDAEREMRIGMSDPVIKTLNLSPTFRLDMQYVLAIALANEGRADEAKAAAKPVCDAAPALVSAGARLNLDSAGLCARFRRGWGT